MLRFTVHFILCFLQYALKSGKTSPEIFEEVVTKTKMFSSQRKVVGEVKEKFSSDVKRV